MPELPAIELTAFGVNLEAKEPEMLLVVGEEIAKVARGNARSKGGRRFWVHDILNSIHNEETGDSQTVGSTHVAAAHKQFGGTISAPGRGEGSLHRKYLTIPVGLARQNRWDTDAAQAAGWQLAMVKKGSKRYLFGTRARKRKATAKRRRKSAKAIPRELLFVLKESVTQPADPWFPMGQELETAVRRGVDLYLKTL